MFNTLFLGLQKSLSDGNQVIDVRAEDYVSNMILCRYEFLVIYKMIEKDGPKLDIVMQLELNQSCTKAFSIHRTGDENACKELFAHFQEKLPLLIHWVPDIGTSKNTLQNIVQVIRENPSWTVAHIAAHFGYTACFKDEVVQSQINMICSEKLMTPLHIAVKARQIAAVNAILELDPRLDITDISGETVFHYAARTSKDIIQVLSKMSTAQVVINLPNYDGLTPIHCACKENKVECVIEFLKCGVNNKAECIPDCSGNNSNADLSSGDNSNAEPNPPRDLKDILNTYRGHIFDMDIKYGGTPLHWSKTSELTEALLELGFDVNTQNFQGDTALHMMVKRKRLPCVVMLLSHQAEVNIQNATGHTPIHLAVMSGDVLMVQALIAFGADLDLLNNKGETPRHIAATEKKSAFGEILYCLHMVGAKRCALPSMACNDGCNKHGQYNGIPPENQTQLIETENIFEDVLQQCSASSCFSQTKTTDQSMHQKCKILCLDGGGIRGLVLIQMLDELERILKKPLSEIFDFVAGTSTGGILALALATGKSMRECRSLYFRLKDKVFVGIRPYNADLLEAFLKEELGESTFMGDITNPKLMITATRCDRKPAILHIFRNYESPLEILNHVEMDVLLNQPVPNSREIPVWKVARASGAAPTYFPASDNYIDGGIISNNPTLDALTEIHQRNQAFKAVGKEDKICEVNVVVSMGTGKPPLVPISSIDIYRPDSVADALKGAYKLAFGVSNLVQLLVDQVTHTDNHVISRSRAMCDMLNIPYFRLNPQLTQDVALDATDTKVLVKMLWETTAYVRNLGEKLVQLKSLLVP
ncbi:85/88 kDa calcium-independent phospholipase A2-like isoform X2 [Uloborus diversus]|uniref:85/88 kDa calcium-independent phospholipase A2-like isoform X2 n=1 Tax=Uloborus diversus TaxID=327109 RepID=UPI00240A0571|nr:85/88 kDa calcium-independent phospholipase A2-like isoform X2 [Uloborus diversus]